MGAINKEEIGELEYDRTAESLAFDETKLGVKGLVDGGITEVPRIFLYPKGYVDECNYAYDGDKVTLPKPPVIDMDGIGTSSSKRKDVIDKIKDASEKWGCFVVLNHGIPNKVLEEMIEGIRRFFEQDDELKKPWYTRDMTKKVVYNFNPDLYKVAQTNWKDTIMFVTAPEVLTPEDLPETCSEIVLKFSEEVLNVGRLLLELLAEGLGHDPNNLKEKGGGVGFVVQSHYSPKCPQPELTIGSNAHTDGPFFTAIIQDNIGGLQVLNQNQWIDVPPIPGALIINIGDFLQHISYEKFKAVKHRVLTSRVGPRISVASAFTVGSNPWGARLRNMAAKPKP